MNDTIVVFDRLRENVLLYPNRTLVDNANLSISESLGRSLNTSLTLFLHPPGGSFFSVARTIRVFLWVLLIGVGRGHVQLHRNRHTRPDRVGDAGLRPLLPSPSCPRRGRLARNVGAGV